MAQRARGRFRTIVVGFCLIACSGCAVPVPVREASIPLADGGAKGSLVAALYVDASEMNDPNAASAANCTYPIQAENSFTAMAAGAITQLFGHVQMSQSPIEAQATSSGAIDYAVSIEVDDLDVELKDLVRLADNAEARVEIALRVVVDGPKGRIETFEIEESAVRKDTIFLGCEPFAELVADTLDDATKKSLMRMVARIRSLNLE